MREAVGGGAKNCNLGDLKYFRVTPIAAVVDLQSVEYGSHGNVLKSRVLGGCHYIMFMSGCGCISG